MNDAIIPIFICIIILMIYRFIDVGDFKNWEAGMKDYLNELEKRIDKLEPPKKRPKPTPGPPKKEYPD